MSALGEDAERLIASGRLAHLVTINSDGSPQVSIIWVGLDGDQLVSGHLSPDQLKMRNMRRDPRVSLSIEAGTRNAHGLDEYLVIHATVSQTEGGAPEVLQRLAEVYLGPGVKFPPMDDPPPGIVCHYTPTKITGIGPWAG